MIYAEQISLAPTYNEKISSENYEIKFRGTWLTIGRNRGSDRIFYKLGNKPCCISSSTKCTSLADVLKFFLRRSSQSYSYFLCFFPFMCSPCQHISQCVQQNFTHLISKYNFMKTYRFCTTYISCTFTRLTTSIINFKMTQLPSTMIVLSLLNFNVFYFNQTISLHRIYTKK